MDAGMDEVCDEGWVNLFVLCGALQPHTPHRVISSPEPPEYKRWLVGGVEGGGFGFMIMSRVAWFIDEGHGFEVWISGRF